MFDKLFKTIILYSFYGIILGGVLWYLLPDLDVGKSVFSMFISFGNLAGLFLLLKDSTIFRTIYLKLLVSVSVLSVALFVVLDLLFDRFNFEIVIIGAAMVFIIYFFRFLNKSEKAFLDYVKVIWLLVLIVGDVFFFMHWPYSDVILYSSQVVFWIGLFKIMYDYKFEAMINKYL